MPLKRHNTMLSGKLIGDTTQYRLETPIAVGAFSTVYRCTQVSTGRTYAMKIIDKQLAADNRMTEALIREVNALEIAGSSPYVTKLVDKMVSRHNFYLVMEMAEGGTLLDLIREQRQELRVLQASLSNRRDLAESLRSGCPPVMQYDRVQHFFKQLLLALASLHDHDVVHRDVKPENILLNKRRTRIVLSDFGFACHAPPGTELHRACGTLRFCAPELLHEYPRYEGRKVDVWAAGVTLYVMLFGGHPFRCAGQDPDSLLEVITTTRIPIPRPIPTEIEDLLRHMLCVDPAERWSVKQLLQHPWMTSPAGDTRSSSARSASATARNGAATVTAVAAAPPVSAVGGEVESVVELLAEECPPIDAIASDDEIVDDGFYQSSTDDKQSSSGSGSPTQSGPSPKLPSSPLSHSTKAAAHDGEAQTVAEDEDVQTAETPEPEPVVVAAAAAATARHEVLQQGAVSTSMTAIDSAEDSDDDDGESQPASDSDFTDDTEAPGAHRVDEVANDVGWRFAQSTRSAGSESDSSNASTTTYREGGELDSMLSRYSYGLLLTARIVLRFCAFFALCVAAVVVRVVLKRDIVDLPLPELLRDYISFVLTTPLRRPRLVPLHRAAHRSLAAAAADRHAVRETERAAAAAAAAQQRQEVGDEGEEATAAAAAAAREAVAGVHRQRKVSSIPGSNLRHYVRSADRLMRDSFVGTAVLEHNASFADAPLALSQTVKDPSEASWMSSPAAPSLATIAPPTPCPSAERVATAGGAAADEAAGAPSSRSPSQPLEVEPSLLASTDGAFSSRGTTPLVTFVATTPKLNPRAVAAAATTASPADSATGPCAECRCRPDSQEGATDTTESVDSGEEKSPAAATTHNMFSPIAPLPRVFPGHRQRTEDFPVVDGA